MTIREYETIGAIMAAIALWGQIRFILGFPIRLIIICREVRDETAEVILSYLSETCNNSPRDRAAYWSRLAMVKPLGRMYRIFAESLTSNRQLFFKGRVPIWYAFNYTASTQPNARRISCFRWTLDWDKFLAEVAAWEDIKRCSTTGERRFRIIYRGGEGISAAKLLKNSTNPSYSDGGIATAPDSIKGSYGNRLLHWKQEDIGAKDQIVLEHMSLRPEMLDVVNEIKFFLESKEWFEEGGIPWRRGWLLHGKPGTGKTSFVRGIAARFDLPVHVFDLSSMSNNTFRNRWSEALSDAPCVVLIEDIDTVFNGRTNLHVGTMLEGSLTYDCLLNCLGGIAPADGVLTFVSSNHPEMVDEALLRGGRLDRPIEVLGLDYPGKLKMAKRILRDPVEAQRIADDPKFNDMTPAELQEELSRIAILRRFS